jgi:hypothetical protein
MTGAIEIGGPRDAFAAVGLHKTSTTWPPWTFEVWSAPR